MPPDYTVFQAGPTDAWNEPTITYTPFGFVRPGGQFLGEPLGLQGAEVSLNSFRPGQRTQFSHRHKLNEELYVFLSGTGEMLLEGRVLPVTAGTCVRCGPRVARDWRNTGTADLVFVVIQYPHKADQPMSFADGEVATDPWPA